MTCNVFKWLSFEYFDKTFFWFNINGSKLEIYFKYKKSAIL